MRTPNADRGENSGSNDCTPKDSSARPLPQEVVRAPRTVEVEWSYWSANLILKSLVQSHRIPRKHVKYVERLET